MNVMKHTPGPWCPVYSSMHERTVIATFDQGKDFPNAIIAIVNSTLHEIDEAPSETDKANARLIAAAPELLAALQALYSEWNSITALVESCDFTPAEANAIQMVESAISKVEGSL